MGASVVSRALEIGFGADPSIIDFVRNRLNGNIVCRNGRQDALIRVHDRISDPERLTNVSRSGRPDLPPGVEEFVFTNDEGAYTASVTVAGDDEGIGFHLVASGPEPIWMVEWTIHGLKLDEVIIPALGGRRISSEMPDGLVDSFQYPVWWNAQFVIGSSGSQSGGIWLHSGETRPRMKVLRVRKEGSDRFALTLGIRADAPLVVANVALSWHIDGYSKSWTEPADRYRSWLESTFDLVPYEQHPHYPEWMNEVNLILQLCGMWPRSVKGHTFEEMTSRIEAFARLHPPKETLLYIPGFAEKGLDSDIPDYRPSPALGGANGLSKLVDRAHELGYRVMLHTNILGMTFNHALFPQFRDLQIKDEFGDLRSWGHDLDGDWMTEPFFAYINPGAHRWGDLFESLVRTLVDEYGADAVHLDQTLLAFTVSNGPNFMDGMKGLVGRLQRSFPQILFQGEGIHEWILPVLPVAQIHGVDSITPVEKVYLAAGSRFGLLPKILSGLSRLVGFKKGRPWIQIHPVSSRVLGRYSRMTPHLLTDHPSGAKFSYQEAAYARLGISPALVCYGSHQTIDGPRVRKMLRRAKSVRSRNHNKEL
ncbi:MAG TPA: DUF6259 domain-containing protein [Rhodothermia bacterium]|nr:DUF6259 domain-containing protein [Rhodothermia bacterium]